MNGLSQTSEHRPATLIIRHAREKPSKCSLRGLEQREDLAFVTFGGTGKPPWTRPALPELSGRVLLTIDAPPLSEADAESGLLLIDGTWRLADRMYRALANELAGTVPRSIPPGFVTAYPRRQTECPDPSRGLASVEALYVAHRMLGFSVEGLLEHYRWADAFLELNKARLQSVRD